MYWRVLGNHKRTEIEIHNTGHSLQHRIFIRRKFPSFDPTFNRMYWVFRMSEYIVARDWTAGLKSTLYLAALSLRIKIFFIFGLNSQAPVQTISWKTCRYVSRGVVQRRLLLFYDVHVLRALVIRLCRLYRLE